MTKFPGRELYIGMDIAVGTGSPMVVSASLLMFPITLLLAFILPWNTVLSLVDLSAIPFFMIWPVVAHKGDLVRALMMMIAILTISILFASYATLVAASTGFAFPEGATATSSFDLGAHWIPFVLYKIFSIF